LILLTGATGYVGGRLLHALEMAGRRVRCLTRHPEALSQRVSPTTEVVAGDVLDPASLAPPMTGVDAAYYLVHAMASAKSFEEEDRKAAHAFAAAVRDAGVKRIVYLGGLGSGSTLSAHLRSRQEVGRILRESGVPTIEFRASIVIGARSRPFRFLVRLIERLPVLALPAWRVNRTSPADERDVIEILARAACSDRVSGSSLDIAGPVVLTYGDLIERIRDHMLLRRPTIGFRRLNAMPVASRVSARVSGEDHALIGPLMEGLLTDLLPRDDRAVELLGISRHSLDAAIERALREWELTEPLAAR